MKKRKGFTLVELLVVIAILAILATVSIIGYTSFIKKANESVYEQERTQQMIADLAEKVEDGGLTDWEDVEQSVLEKVAALVDESKVTRNSDNSISYSNTPSYKAGDTKVDANNTTVNVNVDLDALKDIVNTAISEASKSQLTEEQVKTIIDNALKNFELTDEQLEQLNTYYNDYSIITQMGNALRRATLSGIKINTPYEANQVLENYGINLNKLNVIGKDDVNTYVAYNNKNHSFKIYTATEYNAIENNKGDVNTFILVKDEAGLKFAEGKGFSAYLQAYDKASIETSKGVDVGDVNTITSINYTNTTGNAQDVVIRTNSIDAALTIDAPKDTVKHYDDCGTLTIANIDINNCYEEYGKTLNATLVNGKVVAKGNGIISMLIVDNTDSNDVKVYEEDNGSITLAVAANNVLLNTGSNQNTNLDTGIAEVSESDLAAANGNFETALNKYEAINNNGEFCDSFVDTFNAAQANDTIYLLKDISITSYFNVNKNLTIIGAGHEIETSARRGFCVTTSNVKLTLKGLSVNVTGEGTNNDPNPRALQVNSDLNNVELYVEDCKLSSDGYCINLQQGCDNLTVNIINGSVATGYCGVYIKCKNSTINLEDSSFVGINDAATAASNGFSTIVIQGCTGLVNELTGDYYAIGETGHHNNVTISNCSIKSESINNEQTWLSFSYAAQYNKVVVSNSKIIDGEDKDYTSHYFVEKWQNEDSSIGTILIIDGVSMDTTPTEE